MSEELATTIGTTIRSIRLKAGLSLEQVAQGLDLSLIAYSRMERGKLLPTPSTLMELCMFFGVSADTLLGLPTVKACPLIAQDGDSPIRYSPTPHE